MSCEEIAHRVRKLLASRQERSESLPHDVLLIFLSPFESPEESIVARHSAFEEYNDAVEYTRMLDEKYRTRYRGIRYAIYLDGEEHINGDLLNPLLQ